jgi:hypothetical protein
MNVDNYNANRGPLSPLVEHNGVACGFWLVGADFRNRSRLYGAYPPGYMKRMRLLFPDEFALGRVLHLFSGSQPAAGNEETLDINPESCPTYVGDAEDLLHVVGHARYGLVLADPPYEGQHEHYGTKPVNRRKVVRLCSSIVATGGFLVWLDTVMPMWGKADGWALRGTIGLAQSTNHRVRVATILEMTR